MEVVAPRPFEMQPQMSIVTKEGAPAAQKEITRLKGDWVDAFTQVFDENKQLVVELASSDYVDPTKVALEAAFKDIPDQTEKNAKVGEEVARRKKIREDRVKKEEVTKEDKFKDMPTGNEDQVKAKEKAIEDEIQKRKRIQTAFDTLYTVEAVTKAQPKIQKEIEQAITEMEKAAAAKTPPETVSEELKLAKTAEIAKKYKDGDIYHRLNEKGEPIEDQFVKYSDSYDPIVTELEEMAKDKDDSGNPTEKAKKAEESLKKLQYVKTENKFYVLSEAELQKKELKELEDETVTLVRDAMTAVALEDGNAFEMDASGKIKIPPKLKNGQKLDPNSAYSQMGIFLATYDANVSENANHQLAAFMNEGLSVLLKGRPETDAIRALRQRMQALTPRSEPLHKNVKVSADKVIMEWLVPLGYDAARVNIPPQNYPRALMLALACGELKPNAQGRYELPKGAKKLLDDWHATEAERNFVLGLASSGHVKTLLSSPDFLGLDVASLTAKDAPQKYAKKVVESIKKSRALTPEEEHNITHVSRYHTEESVKKIAEKRKISWGDAFMYLAGGGMLFSMAAPLFEFGGESADDRRGG